MSWLLIWLELVTFRRITYRVKTTLTIKEPSAPLDRNVTPPGPKIGSASLYRRVEVLTSIGYLQLNREATEIWPQSDVELGTTAGTGEKQLLLRQYRLLNFLAGKEDFSMNWTVSDVFKVVIFMVSDFRSWGWKRHAVWYCRGEEIISLFLTNLSRGNMKQSPWLKKDWLYMAALIYIRNWSDTDYFIFKFLLDWRACLLRLSILNIWITSFLICGR